MNLERGMLPIWYTYVTSFIVPVQQHDQRSACTISRMLLRSCSLLLISSITCAVVLPFLLSSILGLCSVVLLAFFTSKPRA